MEANKINDDQERVREVLAEVIEQYNLPVSRLFLENPCFDYRITLGDYFRLHILAEYDTCMRLNIPDAFGMASMEVRDWLTNIRRELIPILSTECLYKGFQFEDVIILNFMFLNHILPGIIDIKYQPGSHSLDTIFDFLEDLCCFLCALPGNEEINNFLSQHHIGVGRVRINLRHLFERLEQLSQESIENEDLFESFQSRIICYAEPRICERGFEKFDKQGKKIAEISLWRSLEKGENFWTNKEDQDQKVLEELRIPTTLIELFPPSNTLYLLQEVVRNLGDRIKDVAILVRGKYIA